VNALLLINVGQNLLISDKKLSFKTSLSLLELRVMFINIL